jgi:hypothetical protein
MVNDDVKKEILESYPEIVKEVEHYIGETLLKSTESIENPLKEFNELKDEVVENLIKMPPREGVNLILGEY